MQADISPFENLHPSGAPYRQGSLKNGQLHGLLREFDEEGVCRLMANFENGLLHGLTQIFDPKGIPIQKCHTNPGCRMAR